MIYGKTAVTDLKKSNQENFLSYLDNANRGSIKTQKSQGYHYSYNQTMKNV